MRLAERGQREQRAGRRQRGGDAGDPPPGRSSRASQVIVRSLSSQAGPAASPGREPPSLARGTPGPGAEDGSQRDDRRRPRSLASVTMEATIEVSGLHKRFGPTLALDGMSFTVQPGQVTGFVGPNGAGKTTTMRVILGLDAADAGTALVSGQPYQSLHHPLSHIGALLDAAALQPSRTARNHLLWLAHRRPRPAGWTRSSSGRAPSAAGRKAGGYSLGMRQRLGIAAALLGDPPVLMLDEPVNGLDPEGIVWMRGFLRSLAAEGRAVLVSSHLMSELEDTADHLVVIGRGRVIADASVRDLIEAASEDQVSCAPRRGRGHGGAGQGGGRGRRDRPRCPHDRRPSRRTDRGGSHRPPFPFTEVTAHRATLEEAYMELTRDAVEFRAARPATEGTAS